MTRPTYTVQVDWDADGTWTDAGEDVTARVLARTPIVVQYGRDQARTLTPIAPGRAQLELDNRSRDYSPENTGSPLYGNVKPGRPIRIQATHNAVTYALFTGYLDDFDVLPDLEERSVALSATDALGRLRGQRVTTELYSGVRVGDAIGYLLDAADWPTAARDLDLGASYLPWWWVDDGDAFDALQDLIRAEGPPALVTVDPSGSVVFRDRHHRITEAASLTSQATFRGSGVEPTMATRLVYDHGWRDIVNQVPISVGERAPSAELDVVWRAPGPLNLSAGQSVQFTARASDPFVNAVPPENGVDFTTISGAVAVALSRTRGASTVITVTADVGAAASIMDLQLRAISLPVARTTVVTSEDTASVDDHGLRSHSGDVPWVNVHDALAVGQLILSNYAERRPVVTMRVVGGHDTRHTQQLARDLSDRVRIIETETGLDADFHIESIQHRTDGISHETVFGCEKAPVPPAAPFTFDVSGRGFNDGEFAQVGLDDTDTVFRFDAGSGHRFNEGVFAT